ncbi:DUF488 domain-containing protein [Prolixibacter denitrificans]|uniref:Uncharacterized protein YeaO (DUF488 family) n=1 Tax=Prolixibacter denitrificans TaxID=1541063 RepID=A0A2P8CFL3_9BACT|nr:DUF488 family protein [Prolixibacter denitrificans]PSK83773.1 uncharacterized protein YeaO (DUF488 family) [Prolixibacter denitrificans]GET23316.1 hypothetical protein JCM18694_35620 [Prolixibacter denitrificans]
MITIRRVYQGAVPGCSYSVLVDRLWPRGISKDAAFWDEWNKEITPGKELRQWFHQDKERRWDEFSQYYARELSQKEDELQRLKKLEAQYGHLVLVYAAKDPIHNHALVLKSVLGQMS